MNCSHHGWRASSVPALSLGHIHPIEGLGSCRPICGSCSCWLHLLRDTKLLLSLLFSNTQAVFINCFTLS